MADVEKQGYDIAQQERDSASAQSSTVPQKHEIQSPSSSRFNRVVSKVISSEVIEKKSIERVLPHERHNSSWLHDGQMLFLWLSANITLNNLAVAVLGPTLFGLGWGDCALCVVLGTLLGGACTAYMSIFGARSGLRTMVVTRFYFGYWPAKIPALLNVVLMLGYCTIDAIIAGQVLSAVSGPDNMTIAVGIVIVSIVVLVIGLCGMRIFHQYERFAWLPQTIVLFILIGVAHKNFNTSLQSTGDSRTLNGNRLSFLSLIFYVPNSWAAAASDFYVYYPERTNRVKIFVLTWIGISSAFLFVNMIGVSLGTAILGNQSYSDAYTVSSGALIVEAFSPLGGFGKFCSVVVALGVIANSVPGTYAASLDLQTTGRLALKIPRWVWIVVQVIIQLACGIAGRNSLLIIFTNFLALMGYWLTITIVIVLVEQVLFQRKKPEFDWSLWNQQKRLPIGVAALVSFLVGWVGAIIGMYQIYFVGPVAAKIGEAGADVGVWLALGMTLVSYPILRLVEIKLGWNRQPY